MDDRGQLEVFLTLGIRHSEMGMQRKAAFFFRRAALCQTKFGQWELAHSLLVRCVASGVTGACVLRASLAGVWFKAVTLLFDGHSFPRASILTFFSFG